MENKKKKKHEDSLNLKKTSKCRKLTSEICCTKTSRAIIVFMNPRLPLQNKQRKRKKGSEELSQKYNFSPSYLKRN